MFSKTLVLVLLTISTSLSFAKSVEMMSFNVENLFDNLHDEGHEDYEYLPKGHPAKAAGCAEIDNDYFRGKCFGTDWSDKILKQKLNAVSEVVYRDGRQVPDILGVVEIENLNVANMLKDKLGYSKALITTGADQRGINVALLFRESANLKYLSHSELEVTTSAMRKPTRNVLQVTFSLDADKKLHVFINHWRVKTILQRIEKLSRESLLSKLKKSEMRVMKKTSLRLWETLTSSLVITQMEFKTYFYLGNREWSMWKAHLDKIEVSPET